MNTLPFYVPLTFGLTVLLALFLFYRATGNSRSFLITVGIWIAIQSALSLSGFYQVSDTTPPRFIFILVPPILTIVLLMTTKIGRRFVDKLNLKTLTLFHIIRIPVEIVLLWLFIGKAVPVLMTFEGQNFDILSGLSAPFIYYFGFVQKKLSRSALIVWNLICLGLLLNIIVTALLSAPSPFQQFAFDQPNIAITYFPYILLPSLLVPLVMLSHLASLRQLLAERDPASPAFL